MLLQRPPSFQLLSLLNRTRYDALQPFVIPPMQPSPTTPPSQILSSTTSCPTSQHLTAMLEYAKHHHKGRRHRPDLLSESALDVDNDENGLENGKRRRRRHQSFASSSDDDSDDDDATNEYKRVLSEPTPTIKNNISYSDVQLLWLAMAGYTHWIDFTILVLTVPDSFLPHNMVYIKHNLFVPS
jgi:hypothetical protein